MDITMKWIIGLTVAGFISTIAGAIARKVISLSGQVSQQEYVNKSLDKRIENIETWKTKHSEDSVVIRQELMAALKDLQTEVKIVIELLQHDFKHLKEKVDSLEG